MSDEQKQEIAYRSEAGPHSPSFLTLVLKTFGGLGGGIAGMLILLLIFLGASTILQPALNPAYIGAEEGTKHPLFIFVFMAMIFLTSLGANLLGSLFFTFVEHERYQRTATVMYHIFFVNMVIFIITVPLYLLLDARGTVDVVGVLSSFQVLLSALASVMILEIVGNSSYALVGVYGVIFSLLASTGIVTVIYEFFGRNPVVVLFAALPATWAMLGFVTVIVEMLYRWLYTLYGNDFLRSETSFGKDYGAPEVAEVVPPPDVTGAEFLGK